MSNKKNSRKGIESLKKRIEEHEEKLGKAKKEDDIGLITYYKKEIENLEESKKNLENRIRPKLKRKKF